MDRLLTPAPLEVTILPEDFKAAPRGYSQPDCPLQNALKRMYPDTYVYAGYRRVVIGKLPDQLMYQIDINKWGTHSGDWPANKINEISERAKESLEGIPTVSLTLEPF